MHHIATTRILHVPERAARNGLVKPWVWPLPRLDGELPCILSSQDPARTDGLVQIGYRARTSSADFVPVFAPQDGIITYAVRAGQTTALCLDHAGGWSTQLSDLETVLALSTDRFCRRRKVPVRAGDVLGYVRKSLRLGFGVSRLVEGQWSTVDPAGLLHDWTAQPWFAEPAERVCSEIAV